MAEEPFEPKIVGFLCRWCSYTGADLAGTSRMQYPPNVTPIRVMCSGRVDAAVSDAPEPLGSVRHRAGSGPPGVDFRFRGRPVHHTLATHWARVIELLYAAERWVEWTVRNDVYYQDARINFKGSPLSPTSNGQTIGPELEFGHVMGYYHDEQVLLIKTAMGNRALGWDFRPPSSGRTDKPGAEQWEGLEYRLMVAGSQGSLRSGMDG